MSIVQDIQDQIQMIKKHKLDQRNNKGADEFEASMNLIENYKKNKEAKEIRELKESNTKESRENKESKEVKFNTSSFNQISIAKTDFQDNRQSRERGLFNKGSQSLIEESKNDNKEIKEFKEFKDFPRESAKDEEKNKKYENFLNEVTPLSNTLSSKEPKSVFDNNTLARNTSKREIKSFLSKAEDKLNNLEQRKNEKKNHIFEMLNNEKSNKSLSSNYISTDNNSAFKIRHQINSLMNTFDIGASYKEKPYDGKTKFAQKIEEKQYSTETCNYSKSIKLTDPMTLLSSNKPKESYSMSFNTMSTTNKDKSDFFSKYE